MLKRWALVALGGVMMLGVCVTAGAAKSEKKGTDQSGPRMVMVEIPSWKTVFFGLPSELPLLIQPGVTFDSQSRQYDFSEGREAMRVFLTMRPKDKHAPAYRRFVEKWPRYQQFFKAVEQEAYDRAEEELKTIQTLDANEPAVYFYFGSLYTHLKQYTQAEKSYQKCLSLYPEYGPAYINLARLAKARGDDLTAKKYLKLALEKIAPDSQKDARQIAEKMLQSLSGQ